jgi:hypothetical protein
MVTASEAKLSFPKRSTQRSEKYQVSSGGAGKAIQNVERTSRRVPANEVISCLFFPIASLPLEGENSQPADKTGFALSKLSSSAWRSGVP